MNRHNPVRSTKQPDLFRAEDTQTNMPWWQATPQELRQAAEDGLLTQDEYDEMLALVEDGDAAMRRQGLSSALIRAFQGGLYEDLEEMDSGGQERRTAPLIKFIQDRVASDTKYTLDDDDEWYVDQFQEDLERQPEHYLEDLRDFLDDRDTPDEVLEQIATDPECYTLAGEINPNGEYHRIGLWQMGRGEITEERDGTEYEEDLEEIVERMSDADIEYAIEYLGNHEPYVSVNTSDRFKSSYSYSWDPALFFVARFNEDRIRERLTELGDTDEKTPDEVVYTYPATWDSVTGPDAKGFYAAKLRPGQLSAEGRDLGICVGNAKYGYKRALKEGVIEIFSIRSAEGRSKFTIEQTVSTGHIVQVKGKANRLPGFDAGKTVLTKPLEVRLAVEFLLFLGLTPEGIEEVSDVQPGVLALKAEGLDPFVPPPRPAKRITAPRANPKATSAARIARLAKAAYAKPWGSELQRKRT